MPVDVNSIIGVSVLPTWTTTDVEISNAKALGNGRGAVMRLPLDSLRGASVASTTSKTLVVTPQLQREKLHVGVAIDAVFLTLQLFR